MATTDSDTHNVDRPLEWFDDERMNFMMSAFPSNREVNCAHWDSKMNFWKQCILRYCQHHHHIDMNRNQLKSILTRNGRQPLGLNLIIDHMLSSNQLIPTSEFQSSSMWIRYLKKSVTWFQNYFIGPPSTTNQWIVLPVIKDVAMSVVDENNQRYKDELFNYIVPWIQLKNYQSLKRYSDAEIEYILTWLQKENYCTISLVNNSVKTIQFCQKHDTLTCDAKEAIMAIGQIKAFMAILQTKIDHHSQLMKSHKERALKYWKDNMKDSARASLSTSKRHQQNVHKCELNYQNLSMHLQLIDDAISNGQILKVYEITTKALNRITTKNEDLSSENIAKIITDFDIAMDDIQEMNDSITGDHSLNQSEMDELNKELQNFELEDTDKIEKVCEKPIDDGLQDSTPTVPSPIQTTATPSIKPRKITAKVARASLVES